MHTFIFQVGHPIISAFIRFFSVCMDEISVDCRLECMHGYHSWPSDIPVRKHGSEKKIESNYQISDMVEKRTSGD